MNITATLFGPRIYLRALQREDASDFLETTHIEEIRYMTGLKNHFSLKDIQAHIQRCLSDPSRYDFAICLNNTDKMIGELSLLEIDTVAKHAEFRISMSSLKWTSQGYGTEAIELVKDFVFHHLQLHTLDLEVFSHNPRGQRAYEKCGFHVVQINKNAFEYQGQYSDEIIMQLKNPNL